MSPCATIVVPALDEARYIGACLESLIPQAERAGAELIVADGGSTDATAAIVAALAARHPCVALRVNPRRTQAAAVNDAAQASHAPVLLRADAHATYPPDFIELCLAALAESGATAVVVPMITAGQGGLQNAVAAAQNSFLGTGGSRHRQRAAASSWVDHGHHAAFNRAFFVGLGGYDETFTHNEDAELDRRALAAGGRIWLCAPAAVTYFPRATLSALARQYFRHGQGRARTLRKHGAWPKPRQLAPIAALAVTATAILIAPWHPAALAAPLAYLGLCAAAGLLTARTLWQACAFLPAVTMHLSWATGFIAAMIRPAPAR